jgi:hypothetical protein
VLGRARGYKCDERTLWPLGELAMGGYVSDGNRGTTELRIHGVSGTPPESMLDHPNVRQIAGDGTAGFYRRWWPVRPEPPHWYDGDTDGRRQEAYSWGGLTAASRLRALWLLLLPFLLVNVAFFMIPYPPTDRPGAPTRLARKASEALQRAFALGLTGMLVLTSASVAMDLVAWQCTRQGVTCTGAGWLRFLRDGFFAQPSRRLALAALVPLATVLLLWWLSRSTWSAYEAWRPPPREDGGQEHAMEYRRLWNGRGPVRRLRVVHVTAGLALVGVLLVAPIAGAGAWTALLRALLGAFLGLLGLSLVLALLPVTATRHDPSGPGVRDRHDPALVMPGLERAYKLLPWLTVALLGLAGGVALLPGVGPAETATGDGRVLPWFSAVFLAVRVLIAVALALVAGLTAYLVRATGGARPAGGGERPPAAAGDLPEQRAWFGLGTPVALLLAWLVGGCFSAGVSLFAAGWLGDPVLAGATTDKPVPLSLPPFYFWAAVGALGIALVLAAGVLVGVLLLRASARRIYRTELPEAYPTRLENGEVPAARRARARDIARTWAIAGGAEIGRVVAGRVVVAASLVLYVLLALSLLPIGGAVFEAVPGWLLAASVTLITGAMLGLVGLGRAAYKDRDKRRSLGILWDLGTFWPRATHPLAPPSYGERVMPDLIERVKHLTPGPGDEVLVSGHSQGAIIAAALVLQLDQAQRARVCLLTYGCPLRRLYSLFFPGYFGLQVLRHLGRHLGPDPGRLDPGRPERAAWAWRNLYRPSDWIGGPVFRRWPAVELLDGVDPAGGDTGDVDRQLIDPPFAPPPGDLVPPVTLGHSNYFADKAFATSRDQVLRLHRRRRVAAPAP